MTKSAQQSYPKIFVSKTSQPWFRAAIEHAMPGATMNAVARTLGNGVTWAMVRSWRRGLAKPPAWVSDKIAGYLQAQAAEALQIASEREHGPGHGGATGTLNLHRYRLERALEREKEKAPD